MAGEELYTYQNAIYVAHSGVHYLGYQDGWSSQLTDHGHGGFLYTNMSVWYSQRGSRQ